MKIAVLITGQLRDWKINATNQLKHLIEPNKADVFVYACNKNTLHTCGDNITQKYNITTTQTKEEIIEDVKNTYGKHLKVIEVNENEVLDDGNFGTLGYFRTRMQNQMDNIRSGYLLAMKYAEENNFAYDIIVRSRPDNSMYPKIIDLSSGKVEENVVYSTQYYTGHRDPWFFAFAKPNTFDKYCSLRYQKDADGTRTDNNFDCPEIEMEKYLSSIGIDLKYAVDICLTFTGFDKTQPVKEFPYRNKNEKLIDSAGNLVKQRLNIREKKIKVISSFLDNSVTFVETGTHRGYTSLACSSLCCHVHTAEIDPVYQRGLRPCANISLYSGSGIEMLRKIGLGEIKSSPPYVFWLDAHDSRVDIEKTKRTLVGELKTIRHYFKKEDIRAILIDDSSGLIMAPEICTVQECCDLIMKIDPSYRISMALGAGTYVGPSAYDVDILIAYHPEFVDSLI